MRGLFVTGTDTGAGKTIVAASLLAAMAAAGQPARAHKPAVTGLEDPPGRWPRDHELLAAVSGSSPDEVSPLRYGPAVSPALAAELAGEPIEPQALVAAARAAGGDAPLIVEGAGGLLSPLARDFTVCDLAVALGLPVVIAASPGLGTINHSVLTVRAARAAGLDVRAVVLTPWPAKADDLERTNREAIARMGEVEVVGLAQVDGPGAQQLAHAGQMLPWQRWLTSD
ncbi:MAG TPA: dethiobiotin synthase [Solirubrobacteraceae bacterium]|jgi:dethiobiotin synthetase|nr:dethiobiotin synthase [Solirubrobacteraceae bacterium]